MKASLGRIKARLAEPAVDRIGELVQLINDNINPPSSVSEGDVYIRAMYIVSDEVNSFGGRFPSEELGRLTELLVDSPVLVGHRKDRLPVARTFHAQVTTREGSPWVKSYFYWLRSAKGADDLKENIDGGIYKECSIGFTYMLPECSVCGKDIRTCRHEPFQQYTVNGTRHQCHFNYRQIDRVLETSLVYRGAVADTAMSKELVTKAVGRSSDDSGKCARVITSPAELPLDSSYLVVPFYESLPVLVRVEEGKLAVTDFDGVSIAAELLDGLGSSELPSLDGAYGQVVGYRGKERCTVEQLRKYLNGRSGAVTRIELKLLPREDVDLSRLVQDGGAAGIRLIRHAYATAADLDSCARRLRTKGGVRFWDVRALPPKHSGYVFEPQGGPGSPSGLYRFCFSDVADDVHLEVSHNGSVTKYTLRQFSLSRFIRGSRFIADRRGNCSSPGAMKFDRIVCGEVASLASGDGGMILEVTGGVSGRIMVQEIMLNGKSRHMIHHQAMTAQGHGGK